MTHQPVLMTEVLDYLAIQPNGIYIDATFGRGGHSQQILKKLDANGRLLAIDKDPSAYTAAQQTALFNDTRFTLEPGSFTQLYQHIAQRGWIGNIAGILLDLGVSSPQLDEGQRGFSFLRDGPLDMRMDTTQALTAAHWINSAASHDLQHALKTYGEEKYARRISAAILNARAQSPIETTGQLADIVAKAHPRWEPQKHPATRTFQAIRIVVNNELEELRSVLNQCLEVLAIGGRLAVISFHSLEDRIVKEFINAQASNSYWPRDLPVTQAMVESKIRLKRIKGPIRASAHECQLNPRARSALLRIMEKIR